MTPLHPYITYSLAVHNCAGYMEAQLQKLTAKLRELPSAEIILVENGSSDGSLGLARELAPQYSTDTITIRVDTVPKGFGNAQRRGLALSRGDHVVVVGFDLPFGFSDLDQWLDMTPRPPLVLGSKGHARSRIRVPLTRRLMSSVFGLARWTILGIGGSDTQGSILIDGNLARRIQPHLACSDYLISTEIVAWATHFGARPVEIPIVYPGAASSTISPVRDGLRMLAGMFALRGRLRRTARYPAPSAAPEVRR